MKSEGVASRFFSDERVKSNRINTVTQACQTQLVQRANTALEIIVQGRTSKYKYTLDFDTRIFNSIYYLGIISI
jgi:hypothetical protein